MTEPGSALPAGPDFLIIGAMKSGTTSLFRYVCDHPLIVPPVQKELHFYDRQTGTLEDYRAQFPERSADMLSGEATPNYLFLEHVPARVAEDFPDARLIAILRNPVDRAWSHYQQRAARGREDRAFSAVIEDEAAGTTGEGSFLARGRYAEQIARWHAAFPAERLHILFTEDLAADPDAELERVFAHLDLAPAPVDTAEVHRSRAYPPLDTALRDRLDAYFLDPNRRLAALLGRALPAGWAA